MNMETNPKQVQPNQDSSDMTEPHESMYLVLAYLPLFELIAMGQVCRSFNDALNDDVLPWMNIVVDEKLRRSRVSDEILMKIASKATGMVRSLVLVNCGKITDDGLQDVVANNLNINKLHVPQCSGLTAKGVIRAVTTLNQHNTTLISLKINGISNIKKEHFQTLCSLLKPIQLQRTKSYLITSKQEETNEFSSSIDVEICPKCDEVRIVHGCPLETCQRKRTTAGCRGCKSCISRCENCKKCLGFDDEEESEAACEDKLCEDCWIKLPKCDHCNKPYCKDHAYKQCVLFGSSGFVCEDCLLKSTIDEI